MNAVINEEVAEFSDYDSDETDSESEQSLNEKLLQAIITHAPSSKIQRHLREGAEPNTVDLNGQTPLHVAAIAENTSAIKILLKQGQMQQLSTIIEKVRFITPQKTMTYL